MQAAWGIAEQQVGAWGIEIDSIYAEGRKRPAEGSLSIMNRCFIFQSTPTNPSLNLQKDSCLFNELEKRSGREGC